MQYAVLPVLLFVVCAVGLAIGLIIIANVFNPIRPGPVKRMPYESGMDPIHDTRRRFDVRFYLLAIAFLVFDVELLFLVPWAVAARPARSGPTSTEEAMAQADSGFRVQGSATDDNQSPAPRGIDAAVANGLVEGRHLVFAGVMVFLALLVLGFVYDWQKGVFQWR